MRDLLFLFSAHHSSICEQRLIGFADAPEDAEIPDGEDEDTEDTDELESSDVDPEDGADELLSRGNTEAERREFHLRAAEKSRKQAEEKAQKEYDATSDESKANKEVELMVQLGASVEKGKITIPKNTTEAMLNRLGGIGMKIAEFFAKIGAMWEKAFGPKTPAGAPAATPAAKPAPAPEKKLDKAEFETEAALLKNASEGVRADPDAYRSALEEEKRVLELPEHKAFLNPSHTTRLTRITSELRRLDGEKNGKDERRKVESILAGKPNRTWNKDPNPLILTEYKKLSSNVFIRKEVGGKVETLLSNGKWMKSSMAAHIQDRDEATKYEQMLDAVGTNGDDFVKIPSGLPNFLYGHLTDDPFSMIARTQETEANGAKRTVMYRYYPPYRGWEKF